jgi:hypothetical protein
MENVEEMFAKVKDEFLKFNKIEEKRSKRRDLCAFIFLSETGLSTGETKNIIGEAEHDKIYFEIDMNAFAKHVREAEVLYLVRCGVFYDSASGRLAMEM